MSLIPWQRVFGHLSPAGDRARLTVLIMHRVLPQPDALFPELPDASRFETQMRWVAKWFNVLTLAEAVERLRKRSLPERALAITFDDGYADNATVAAPILKALKLPATFFITTGVLNGGRMWNDTVIEAVRVARAERLELTDLGLGSYQLDGVARRREAIDSILAAIKRLPFATRSAIVAEIAERIGQPLPSDLMMTEEHVRGLAASGIDIGAHTVTHPILTRLDDAAAAREIADSRDTLEQLSGRKVRLFAYPNGVPRQDYDARHVDMVRRLGFDAAFSTAWGAAHGASDLYQLPRFMPWDRRESRFALRLARNLLSGAKQRAMTARRSAA